MTVRRAGLEEDAELLELGPAPVAVGCDVGAGVGCGVGTVESPMEPANGSACSLEPAPVAVGCGVGAGVGCGVGTVESPMEPANGSACSLEIVRSMNASTTSWEAEAGLMVGTCPSPANIATACSGPAPGSWIESMTG